MFNNQRPGIYSRIEISGYHPGFGAGAALLLPAREQESPATVRAESCHDAALLLAGNDLALGCLRLLFEGGAGSVTVIIAPDIAGAIDRLGALIHGEIRAVVSGFNHPGELAALRDFIQQRELIGFAGTGPAQAAINAASSLSSGRMVLCAPALSLETGEPHPLYGPCALAGAALGARSPIHNFSGEIFPLLREVSPLPEDDVQALLRAGISVFEKAGEGVELIRAVTTDAHREGSGGAMRSLNTVLIIDDVMSAIRGSLRRKLRGPGRASIEGIRDQVAVELSAKKDAGILASFAPPRCRADKTDPTICIVEISFGAAHLLDQIHLTAHIRV